MLKGNYTNTQNIKPLLMKKEGEWKSLILLWSVIILESLQSLFYDWKKFNGNLTLAMTPEMNTVGLGGLKKIIEIICTNYLAGKNENYITHRRQKPSRIFGI